jgi:RNA polymerase sigma-70 factor (ECF subfamily)
MIMEEVVERYKNMVYGIALARVRNRDDADDVFQEVFLAYCRRQPQFNDEEHRKAWLINTAVNCSKKMVSNARKHDHVPLDEVAESMCFEMQEDSQIFAALADLPEKYRICMQLFYIEDMTVEQISQVVHKRAGTVRVRMNRGREMLREKLKGDYWYE